MALGSNVKRLRESAGLTQTELAERAGMDQQALGALEKRDSKSSAFTAALAAALGKSVNELLGLAGAGEVIPPMPSSHVDTKEICELVALYGQCKPELRALVMASARSGAKKSNAALGTDAVNKT